MAFAVGEDTIEPPSEICTDSALLDDPFDAIGQQVFTDIEKMYGEEEYLLSGAVLAARNADVDRVNDAIFRRFAGEGFVLKSVDSAVGEDEDGLYPVEIINCLDISGIPPHTLRLKVGIPPMLLMNSNAEHGMCNGSKSIVRGIRPCASRWKSIQGSFRGRWNLSPASLSSHRAPTFLPRWHATSSPMWPFFAISMNKSQGLPLLRVGIYLPKSVFSHGKLYAALRRARRKSDIRVVLPFTSDRPRARNVVYKEHPVQTIRREQFATQMHRPVAYLFLRSPKASPVLFARISIEPSPISLIVPQISVTSPIISEIRIPRASSGDYKRVAYLKPKVFSPLL